MKRILFPLFLAVLVMSACKRGNLNSDAKPNVIIFLTDDQGWGDLSIHGNTNLQTPHIDQLSVNGASFDHFYVSPVCSPTRAELLTGRYHARGGVYSTSAGGERLDLDETTIAELFKGAGYRTAAYGKWHNGMQPPYHPNARGFDDYYGFCSGHWGHYFSPMLEHNGRIVQGEGYLTDDFTNHAISFIEESKDQPFFLYIPYNTPHSPMQAPEEYWMRQKGKDLDMYHRDPEKEDSMYTKAALAMVENIDWNVGRVMDKLDELGLTDNTIVVFFTDNGPNGARWNGGMKGWKGHTDEGGVRAPLFIQWKNNIEAGTRIPQITSAMDLLPTLTDLAGIDFAAPKALDGRSLKPLIMGDAGDWKDRLIVSEWHQKVSVRSQDFRLDWQDQLFDMKSDPGQAKDVSGEYPEVKAGLLNAKGEWIEEVLGELPDKDERPFPVGHPEYPFTQLPARDGIGHGNLERSNKWPNCSFYRNWISESDSITWDVEVLEEGSYQVELYYTCADNNVGTVMELSFAKESISKVINKAHDPLLYGYEYYLLPIKESPYKDFIPIHMGEIHLTAGKGLLTLKALEIPGETSIDFRLLLLNR
ncbi:MAG: arylsulfatase [Bacteroidetes bacterium]|nr:arylsulfatase [Bacteroidota bacterium]